MGSHNDSDRCMPERVFYNVKTPNVAITCNQSAQIRSCSDKFNLDNKFGISSILCFRSVNCVECKIIFMRKI